MRETGSKVVEDLVGYVRVCRVFLDRNVLNTGCLERFKNKDANFRTCCRNQPVEGIVLKGLYNGSKKKGDFTSHSLGSFKESFSRKESVMIPRFIS